MKTCAFHQLMFLFGGSNCETFLSLQQQLQISLPLFRQDNLNLLRVKNYSLSHLPCQICAIVSTYTTSILVRLTDTRRQLTWRIVLSFLSLFVSTLKPHSAQFSLPFHCFYRLGTHVKRFLHVKSLYTISIMSKCVYYSIDIGMWT